MSLYLNTDRLSKIGSYNFEIIQDLGKYHPGFVIQKPCCICRRGMHSGRSSETTLRQKSSRPRRCSSSCAPNQSFEKWPDRIRTRNVADSESLKMTTIFYTSRPQVSVNLLLELWVNCSNLVGPPCKLFSGRTMTFSWTWCEAAVYVAFPHPGTAYLDFMIKLKSSRCFDVQRSAKRLVRGYLFCLPLPGSCLARFAYLIADFCTCMADGPIS